MIPSTEHPRTSQHWQGDDEVLQYLAGELPEGVAAVRLQHVSCCVECQRLLDAWTQTATVPPTKEELAAYHARDPRSAAERVREILVRAAGRPGLRAGSVGGLTGTARIGGQDPASRRRRAASRALPLAAVLSAPALLLAVVYLRGQAPSVIEVEAPVRAALAQAADLVPDGVASPLLLAMSEGEDRGAVRGDRAAPPAGSDRRLPQVERELLRLLSERSGRRQSSVLNALGHLKLATARLALAAENYERALGVDRHDAEALIGMAAVCERRAQAAEDARGRAALRQEADRWLALVPRSSPHRWIAVYNRVQVALALGDSLRARDLVQEYRSLDPGSDRAATLEKAVNPRSPQ